jgi:hypothetical protein
VRRYGCELGRKTPFGQRCTVGLPVTRVDKRAQVRSVRNVRPGENARRLVACCVLRNFLPRPEAIKLLDVVALLVDKPPERLAAGLGIGEGVSIRAPRARGAPARPSPFAVRRSPFASLFQSAPRARAGRLERRRRS